MGAPRPSSKCSTSALETLIGAARGARPLQPTWQARARTEAAAPHRSRRRCKRPGPMTHHLVPRSPRAEGDPSPMTAGGFRSDTRGPRTAQAAPIPEGLYPRLDQAPTRRASLVHAAHSVDRHILDQKLVLDKVIVDIRVRFDPGSAILRGRRFNHL